MSISQQRVVEFLRQFKDPQTGQCTPSMKQIAEGLGLSRGYVQRLVSDLVRKGIVASEERWAYLDGEDELPYRASNLYRILRETASIRIRAIMSTFADWFRSLRVRMAA